MLQVLYVSVVLTVLGFVAVTQAQFLIPPRYQQGYYNPSGQMPSNLLCDVCADLSVPSGSWAVGLDSPSISTTNDMLSFEVNIRPVTDIPPGGTSTAEDFVTSFRMNLGFSNATGLTSSSCTSIFGDEFLRTRGQSAISLYTLSSEVALRTSGAVVAVSNAATGSIPGRSSHFAQLPASSRDALLVATVTCPIDLTANVAGISLNGVGYASNNKRLARADEKSLNQEVLTVASSNLLNYPLDGTTQHLTRLDIHSDGAGADLHFAKSIPSSPNNTNNLVLLLGGSSSLTTYTSAVVDTDILRYRFGSGAALSASTTLQVVRNGDYYGISATTLNTIAKTYPGDALYIERVSTVNTSNTQITVGFNTALYDDPVSALAFRVVLTTTSSVVSTVTVSRVTTTSNVGEYILTMNTLKSAMGTERFNIELVLDGVAAAVPPYYAAYPYQTAATNITFYNLASPVITSVTVSGNTPYATSRDVSISVSDTEGIASVGFTQSTLSAVQACASTDTTSIFEVQSGGPSMTNVIATHTFNQGTIDPIFVCAFAVDSDNNVTTATAAMVVMVANIDSDSPTIVIDGPPPNISASATITGAVSNQETASGSVSGLASFGYVVQTPNDACTTTTVPTTTLTNLAANPNASLVFATTENGVRLCFVARDNAGNAVAAASQVTHVDSMPPQIEITGPPPAISSMARITGRVISSETVVTAVSGLASFGYAVQTSNDACRTTTVPTTTLTSPAVNPNTPLVFTTTENGVRLCFVAWDNVGNANARASQATTRIDVNAPQHPEVIMISSKNSVLEIVYIGSNNITFTTASQALSNRGIRVDVLNPDSVREATLSTVTILGRTLRIEVVPTDISTDGSIFAIDGVRGVLVDGDGIARSRTGIEDYRVTIMPNMIQDIVGNVFPDRRSG